MEASSLPASGQSASQVPNANWNDDQVNFDDDHPQNQNDNARFRSSGVRLCALHGFQPPTEHSADFRGGGLRLENLRFICNVEFQKETELEHGGFLMCSRADEVGRLHRLWRVLCHDEFPQTIEHALFQACPKAVAPALFRMGYDIRDGFVEIVYPVDDGKRIHGYRLICVVALLAEVCAWQKADGRTRTFPLPSGSEPPRALQRAPNGYVPSWSVSHVHGERHEEASHRRCAPP